MFQWKRQTAVTSGTYPSVYNLILMSCIYHCYCDRKRKAKWLTNADVWCLWWETCWAVAAVITCVTSGHRLQDNGVHYTDGWNRWVCMLNYTTRWSVWMQLDISMLNPLSLVWLCPPAACWEQEMNHKRKLHWVLWDAGCAQEAGRGFIQMH